MVIFPLKMVIFPLKMVIFPLKMVIFHCYVSSPEGIQTDLRCPGTGLSSLQAESWRSRRVGGAAVLTYDVWEMQWVM